MAEHLQAFWHLFGSDCRLEFHLFVVPGLCDFTESDVKIMHDKLPILEVKAHLAYTRPWDLVVCADHCFGNARHRYKTVYIGHGPVGKIASGDSMEYSCGQKAHDHKGRPPL